MKKKKCITNLVIVFAIIYCFFGSLFGATVQKENGNVCKKSPMAIPICSGDINAE